MFENLKKGDLVAISQATGYSFAYVYKIASGKRPTNSRGGKLISKAAQRIIKDREELKKLCEEIRHNAINDLEPALYGRENFSNTQVAA